MEAARHEVVHEVVAAGDGGEHVVDEALARLRRHLLETETGGVAGSRLAARGCAAHSLNLLRLPAAGQGMPDSWVLIVGACRRNEVRGSCPESVPHEL